MFNIFSLADPFAYRLEPLLDVSFERIPVVHLPAGSAAGQSPDQWQRLRERLSMKAYFKANENASAATLPPSPEAAPDTQDPTSLASQNSPTPSLSDKADDQTLGRLKGLNPEFFLSSSNVKDFP